MGCFDVVFSRANGDEPRHTLSRSSTDTDGTTASTYPPEKHGLEDASRETVRAPGGLSARAQWNCDKLSPVLSSFERVIHNTYHPKRNPEGIINAGIAENSLNHTLVKEYYASVPLEFQDLTYGDDFGCSRRLKTRYAAFLNTHLTPAVPVTSEQVFVAAGVSTIIDECCYNICDPGDGILIAAPYYNGFDIDLTIRSSAVPIAVTIPHGMDPFSHSTLALFEAEMQRRRGRGVRGVILCNPHNPLGHCYPRRTVLAYLEFCRKWDIWLISDEIYAFSTFSTTTTTTTTGDDASFHSVLSFTDRERAGFEKILMLEGTSKDFCINGLRVGCCVAQHSKSMQLALTAVSITAKISSLADAAFSKILADTTFLHAFLAGNRVKLGEAYAFFTKWCEQRDITYLPSNAGHFVVLDLRSFLTQATFAAESALAERMIECGVMVSPGQVYHFSEPGFFRFTFSMRRDYLDVALKRFETALRI